MTKGQFWALAAIQWLIFVSILLEWHDRTVKDMLTSWNVLVSYAIVQAWLHYDLHEKVNKRSKDETKP